VERDISERQNGKSLIRWREQHTGNYWTTTVEHNLVWLKIWSDSQQYLQALLIKCPGRAENFSVFITSISSVHDINWKLSKYLLMHI
jgi:hypothetical protein